MREVLTVKYCVVRDYSAYAPALGEVVCADFRDETDAINYFYWVQRKWREEERKYPGQVFRWKLYKRTDYFHKEGQPSCSWQLLKE